MNKKTRWGMINNIKKHHQVTKIPTMRLGLFHIRVAIWALVLDGICFIPSVPSVPFSFICTPVLVTSRVMSRMPGT